MMYLLLSRWQCTQSGLLLSMLAGNDTMYMPTVTRARSTSESEPSLRRMPVVTASMYVLTRTADILQPPFCRKVAVDSPELIAKVTDPAGTKGSLRACASVTRMMLWPPPWA